VSLLELLGSEEDRVALLGRVLPSSSGLHGGVDSAQRSGFSGASPAYVKFGDILNANGYERFAVVDDREEEPEAEIVRLLFQVATVIEWSEREKWLGEVTGSR
jgi:hypothetical protein